jgi:hypothetical protein
LIGIVRSDGVLHRLKIAVRTKVESGENRLSEFNRTVTEGEIDITKASAHLPGLNIEGVHRRSPAGDAEQISINLQAIPSFEAFRRYLEATNPFAFWAQATQLMWLPWFEAARAAALPLTAATPLPDASAQTPSTSNKQQVAE